MLKPPPFPEHPVLPLTEARVQLFRLVEDLLAGKVERVLLSLRGETERVALVPESVLARLEGELAELRARVGPEPRPLAGLARAHAPVEDIVAELRAQQSSLGTAKEASLYGTGTRPAARVAEAASKRGGKTARRKGR